MSARTFRLVSALAGLLCASGTAFAAPSGVPRLVPSAFVALFALETEPVAPARLLEAALALSGASEGETLKVEAALTPVLAEAEALGKSLSDEYLRGAAVLELLHARVLGGYESRQTRVDETVLSGYYNCVSASVLYAILAAEAGLRTAGVLTKDHVFCSVATAGTAKGSVDVETTSKFGYDPGTKKEFRDSFGKNTGFAYVPPSDYRARTAIGHKALVGLVLSNRITALEAAGRYPEAMELAVDYHVLSDDAASLVMLMDRAANVFAWHTNAGRFAEALAWAETAVGGLSWAVAADPSGKERLEGLVRAGKLNTLASYGERNAWAAGLERARAWRAEGLDAEGLLDFAAAATGNLVMAAVRAAKFGEARSILAVNADMLSARDVAEKTRMIADASLARLVTTGGFDESLAAVEAAFAGGEIPKARRDEFLVYLNGRRAESIAEREGWLAAWRSLDAALVDFPGDRILLQAAAAYRSNWIAEVHNRFAKAYNSGDVATGRAAIEQALLVLPSNPTFLADLELAGKAADGRR